MTNTTSRQVSGGTLVAVGMVTMNVLAYVLTVVVARMLVPQEFGIFTAVLAVILVGNVVSLGIQATVARRLAVYPNMTLAIIAQARRGTLALALSIGGFVAVMTVVLTPILHLDSYFPVMLAGATLIPMTIMGTQMGIAQGQSRWGALTSLYLAYGLGRLLGGVIAITISPTVVSAIIGLAVGAWLPVLVGFPLITGKPSTATVNLPPLMREVVIGSHALFAYLLLTSVDSIIARNRFEAHDAGLYAAGLILAKAALFFPQFVTIVAFPNMARTDSKATRGKAVLLVVGFGIAATAGTWLLPELALILVGGDAYREIVGNLWLFTLAGSSMAVLHLLVFDALARHARNVVRYLWGGFITLVGGAFILNPNVTSLVMLVIFVTAGLSIFMWLIPPKGRSVRGVEPRTTNTD